MTDASVQTDPWDQAWWDYFNGDTTATVVLTSPDGTIQDIPLTLFFRPPAEFPPQEWLAIDLCRGSVLDVGAGSGCHSLVLQERGYAVTAIDISQTAVDIMTARGIHQVYQRDIWEIDGSFDTLLLLMNGIGLVQTWSGLRKFLTQAQQWLNPGGQILMDSCDLGTEAEMTFAVEYRGRQGSPIHWLYVDPDTLMDQAEQTGWYCQVIYQSAQGDYLARLVPV